MAGLLATAELVPDRMRARPPTRRASAAVDLAEWLVEQGLPVPGGPRGVGALVRQAVERGVPLDELVMTEPDLGPDALALLEPGRRRRTRRRRRAAPVAGVGRGAARRRRRHALAAQAGWRRRRVEPHAAARRSTRATRATSRPAC